MKHKKLLLSATWLSIAAFLLIPLTAMALGAGDRSAVRDSSAVALQSGTSVNGQQQAPGINQPQPNANNSPATPTPDKLLQETGEPSSSALKEQLAAWISTLSKEPGFAEWAGAAWEVYPLGPGTHSWNVVVLSHGREIGYIVVASTPEGGYQLMEYGAGSNPLFSMNTLYQSLVQRELIPAATTYESFAATPAVKLIRWYFPPLQAFWQVETGDHILYLDAKNGEELPDLTAWLAEAKQLQADPSGTNSGAAPLAITQADSWEPGDPLLKAAWMKSAPSAPVSFVQWKESATTAKEPFTYLGEWYGGTALYPLAVAGYHVWDDTRPYLQLDHSGGSRYVPYEAALTLGSLTPDS